MPKVMETDLRKPDLPGLEFEVPKKVSGRNRSAYVRWVVPKSIV